MKKFETYTKEYLFALLISGNKSEKYDALKELCRRYKDINYAAIKELAEQHIKEQFHKEKGRLIL